MYMTFFLMLYCMAIHVAVSLAVPKKAGEDPKKLYWAHPLESLSFKGWSGIGNYKIMAAALLLIMAVLYAFFFDPKGYRKMEKTQAAAAAVTSGAR